MKKRTIGIIHNLFDLIFFVCLFCYVNQLLKILFFIVALFLKNFQITLDSKIAVLDVYIIFDCSIRYHYSYGIWYKSVFVNGGGVTIWFNLNTIQISIVVNVELAAITIIL